ncbi:hypothetical protein pdam_00018206 [Pocillopora damicornis]|uniref:Endonuclease/exonuclease/phosphatase domain-containing protein n=1 Tax=Pocillopora damicornis TaxID=46731 RepID=A0A3M6U9B0_POCDA|nr:hypothetical protein pdam_00018206 [Pocillopora damicornis]
MLRHQYSTRKYLFILFLLISNDIQLNPGPLNSLTLKLCSLNARSIVNKRTELQAIVFTKELDIITITETRLNPDIMDQEVLSSDYNIYRRDRQEKVVVFWITFAVIDVVTSKLTVKSFGVKSISIPAQHTLLEYTTALLAPGTLPMEWKSAHVIPILNKC